MKKEYDYEKTQERKYKVNDWFFNTFLIILALLIIGGLILLLGKYAGYAAIALLIVGARLYVVHHDSERHFQIKHTERMLRKPKFKYLSDEQIQEIINEIY